MSGEIQTECTYFSIPGEVNTQRTLELAMRRMSDLQLKDILVASTSGKTGVYAAKLFREKLIVVTHSTGFLEPNLQMFDPENRCLIEASGGRILTCQHALGGVNRAIRYTYQTYQVDEIIANTLRIFGQGIKVGMEMAIMACDAGMVKSGEPVMCVAGSSGGADTAVVLLPANAHRFFDLKVVEIVCRPSPSHPGFPD